jgi:hypothetical protein
MEDPIITCYRETLLEVTMPPFSKLAKNRQGRGKPPQNVIVTGSK